MADDRIRISTRVFPETHRFLEEARIANHRSLGAEIAYRLEASIREEQQREAMSSGLDTSGWPTADRLVREGQAAIAKSKARKR